MAYKVVIPQNMGRQESVLAELEKEGCEFVRLPAPAGFAWTPELMERYFKDADAFMGTFPGAMRITREVLEGAPKLRVGVSPIIGTESIDVEAATDLGIVIGYGALPENFLGVSEACVMLIAALLKRLPQKWEAVQTGGWRVDFAGKMVMSSTIGIIGLGNVGKGVARRLAGWDCKILACDPYIDSAEARAVNAELVDLDTLLRQSDVVSCNVVLTSETSKMLGEREFGLMQPGSYFINT